MDYLVDIERYFSDTKTFPVKAESKDAAIEIAIELAKTVTWPWPTNPSFSIMHAEEADETPSENPIRYAETVLPL